MDNRIPNHPNDPDNDAPERFVDDINERVGDYLDSNDGLAVSREIDEYADTDALWSAQRSLLIAYRNYLPYTEEFGMSKEGQVAFLNMNSLAKSYCKLMNEAIERKLQQD